MLLVTLGFIGIELAVPEIGLWQLEYWPLLIVAIVIAITCEIMIFCCGHCCCYTAKPPLNYILLTIFLICECYIIGFICAWSDPQNVFFALVLASAGFIGMTIFAFVCPYDVTVWWGVLLGLSLILLVMTIILLFVQDKVLLIVVASLGTLLALIYVTYDT